MLSALRRTRDRQQIFNYLFNFQRKWESDGIVVAVTQFNYGGTNQTMKKASKRSPKESDSKTSGAKEDFGLTKSEQTEVEKKRPPRPVVLHEVVRREGEQELSRRFAALLWSAIAAGLTMGFSFVARGLLRSHTGDYPERVLIEGLGYSVGFVITIIARQQLFTENTMTAVLPLMAQPSWSKLASLARLWGTVLMGNLIGVALFAYGTLHLSQYDTETQNALIGICEDLMRNTPWQMITKGIMAGWLVATMVWMIASTTNAQLPIIIVVTSLIAIGGFTHIVVGSAESLYMVFAGKLSMGAYVFDFALPTLAGNVVGGSFIFALISHAEVRSDAE